jgi:splicing factor, arginine/serine-rich 12
VNFDARKIEETRRTILLIDIKSSWKLEDLMDHFKQAGEVKYARYAENSRSRMALIEFCEQKCLINALKMQGQEFHGVPLNIYHSTQPIIKPEAKSNEAAQREIEEAMCIVKEAQNMISAAIDPVIGLLSKDKASISSRHRTISRSRSRSRSKDRHHSRSISRKRSVRRSISRSKRSTSRRRTRSRSRDRSSRSKLKRRSPSRTRRTRSRERDYKRKRSSPRRRSRSRSKGSSRRREHRRASRSRSRKRSRSRDRKKSHRKDERRRKSRSRSHESSHRRDVRPERERSLSRGRSSRSERERVVVIPKRRSRTPEKRLKKISEEHVVRDYDAEEQIGLDENGRTKSKSVSKEKSISPEKSDNMDISNSP